MDDCFNLLLIFLLVLGNIISLASTQCIQPEQAIDGGFNSTVATPDGLDVGAKAYYTCGDGHSTLDSLTRTCLENNLWSGRRPLCFRNIIPLPDCGEPDHSSSTTVQYNTTTENSTAVYTCVQGYTSVHSQEDLTRVCLNNGQWSGEPPECHADCGAPALSSSTTVKFQATTENSTADYSCVAGLTTLLSPGNLTRVCLGTGQWSGETPKCEVKITCGPVTFIKNGNVKIQRMGTGTESFSIGSQVLYSCKDGFQLRNGDSVRECQENGMWSGETPQCFGTGCISLPNLDNGYVYSTGYELGDTAVAECLPGFYLEGESMLTCTVDGWKPKNTVCRVADHSSCSTINCKPSGMCHVNSSTGLAYCICIKGYYGKYCESYGKLQGQFQRENTPDVSTPSACASNPCGENGRCSEDPNSYQSYSCECDIGYSGIHCDARGIDNMGGDEFAGRGSQSGSGEQDGGGDNEPLPAWFITLIVIAVVGIISTVMLGYFYKMYRTKSEGAAPGSALQSAKAPDFSILGGSEQILSYQSGKSGKSASMPEEDPEQHDGRSSHGSKAKRSHDGKSSRSEESSKRRKSSTGSPLQKTESVVRPGSSASVPRSNSAISGVSSRRSVTTKDGITIDNQILKEYRDVITIHRAMPSDPQVDSPQGPSSKSTHKSTVRIIDPKEKFSGTSVDDTFKGEIKLSASRSTISTGSFSGFPTSGDSDYTSSKSSKSNPMATASTNSQLSSDQDDLHDFSGYISLSRYEKI